MHEYAVVSALIEQVEIQAKKNGADRVHRVIVKLGERAGVERGLFETAFLTFRERTVCESAELVIEAVPARWACPKCAAEIPRGAALSCASCRVPASLVEGAELLLQTIEMEVSDV